MLPGRCWDAELARGQARARSGLLLSCPGPGSTRMLLAPPRRGCSHVPLVLFWGGEVAAGSRRKPDSASRLGAEKTLGEVTGAMIHHVPVTRTGIFLSRE